MMNGEPLKEEFQPLTEHNRTDDKINRPKLSYWQDAWRRLKQNKLAVFSLGVIIFLIVMAVLVPWLSKYGYDQQHLSDSNEKPGGKFWFGSDGLGRDLFTRVWYGARISLFIGFAASAIDLIIGVIWGGIAGYMGGRVDEVMMRICDVLYGLPYILVVVLLLVVMEQGLFTIIVAMSITAWVNMARIVRGEMLRLKEEEYIMATRSMGANMLHILFKHLIPNSMGPILVTLTFSIPNAIFTEAFLSFLGLGVQDPQASWGTLTKEGIDAMQYYPWMVLFPAVFISLAMLAFNILGDGLRDALDPRMRS